MPVVITALKSLSSTIYVLHKDNILQVHVHGVVAQLTLSPARDSQYCACFIHVNFVSLELLFFFSVFKMFFVECAFALLIFLGFDVIVPPPTRCAVCLDPLPESYYELDGQAFCMEHFYEKSAHRCQKCGGYITGPTMVCTCMWGEGGEGEKDGGERGDKVMIVQSKSIKDVSKYLRQLDTLLEMCEVTIRTHSMSYMYILL